MLHKLSQIFQFIKSSSVIMIQHKVGDWVISIKVRYNHKDIHMAAASVFLAKNRFSSTW